jgi:hypothetical protein
MDNLYISISQPHGMTGRYEILRKINQNTFSVYIAPGRVLSEALIPGPVRMMHGPVTYLTFGHAHPFLSLPPDQTHRIGFRRVEGMSGLIGAIRKDESHLLFIQYSREHLEEYETSIPVLLRHAERMHDIMPRLSSLPTIMMRSSNRSAYVQTGTSSLPIRHGRQKEGDGIWDRKRCMNAPGQMALLHPEKKSSGTDNSHCLSELLFHLETGAVIRTIPLITGSLPSTDRTAEYRTRPSKKGYERDEEE